MCALLARHTFLSSLIEWERKMEMSCIYIKKTVFNREAIVFSISLIQKVVQFSKSNPTNYLEESRDVAKQHHCSRH